MKHYGWLFVVVSLLGATPLWSQDWQSDIPLLKSEHLNAAFWQQRWPDKELLNAKQIKQHNQQLFASGLLTDVLALPEQESAAKAQDLIRQLSKKTERFTANGEKVSEQQWQQYVSSLALEQLTSPQKYRFGLVVSRALVRTFPTMDRVFNQSMDLNLDRFMETAIFPGQAVAVLWQSLDRQWYFVRHYHYDGWVEAKHIALGTKAEVAAYVDPVQAPSATYSGPRLIVTGAKAATNFTPEQPVLSEVQLDMGVSLPLQNHKAGTLYGQNTAFSYQVLLPVRQQDGTLALQQALISRSQDVQAGYLSLTRHQFISQAFKFLGERYGWGHDYNARDCSGLVGELYRSFGLLLPRNTSTQGKASYGLNQRFEDGDTQIPQRLKALQQAEVGDMLFVPGHVMLYLGRINDEPFVIHDVSGLELKKADGSDYKSALAGVSVTPLTPLRLSAEASYLQRLHNIQSLTKEKQ